MYSTRQLDYRFLRPWIVTGMGNESRTPEEQHRHGDGGSKYPGPPELTEEEQRQYDEIHERIVARLKEQANGRRSRWRPPEP